MGDLSNLFMFKSREQREREEEAYRERMLPFGVEETKRKVYETLKPISPKKRRIEETAFMYLVAKQAYLDSDGDVETAYNKLKKASYKPTAEEMKAIVALLTLEEGAASLDDYPTLEQILAAAEKIEL